MKKYSLLTLFLYAFSYCSSAQVSTVPAIEWQKCFGGSREDHAYCIKQTSDGGYIIAGDTYSSDGDVTSNDGLGDYWIVKLNNIGIIQWQKNLGGSGDEQARAIEETANGGFIIAGWSSSNDGDVSGNHSGSNDYWIVKINSAGIIEWQRSLGGNNDDLAESIKQTNDGGFIVAGTSNSNDVDVTGNHGGSDFWIVKLGNTGNIEWQRSLGGSLNDFSSSIVPTADGGYIAAGSTYSNDGDVTGNHGFADCWVVKLGSTGVIEWQKTLGGTGDVEHVRSVIQTYDGGYMAAGHSNSNDGDVSNNNGDSDYWLVKLSSSGVIQWQKSFGDRSGDNATSIKQTPDSGYIVSGSSQFYLGDVRGNHGGADYWTLKLSSIGIIEWQKCLGGVTSDVNTSMDKTSDNGSILAGWSDSNDGDVTNNHGSSDYWIVKLAPDPSPDLFIRDRPDDTGAEPNPTTQPMWQSEDIWLRQTQDPPHAFAHITENGEYRNGTANPNYVYVKVRNRGGVANSGTERLSLYWAKAGSGLSWTTPWTGGTYFDAPANTMLMGDTIGTITLPIVPAGDSTILEFAWNPPNPANYTGTLSADQNHFCLLARVVTLSGMTFPETTDLNSNVQNNNNIAWKNIGVYDIQQLIQSPSYATIENLTPLPMNVTLKFITSDAEGNPALLNNGTCRITAEGKLKDIFIKNNVTGEGFKDEGNGVYLLTKDGAELKNIPLQPKDIGFIKTVFIPNKSGKKLNGFSVTVTQLESKGGQNRIIGGQTAVFGQVKGFGTSGKKKRKSFCEWFHNLFSWL